MSWKWGVRVMGKTSALRRKIRLKKEKAAKVNFDNAKPGQIAGLMAERDKLIENAEKRLPKAKRALLHPSKRGSDK